MWAGANLWVVKRKNYKRYWWSLPILLRTGKILVPNNKVPSETKHTKIRACQENEGGGCCSFSQVVPPYFLWDTLDPKVIHSDGFADFIPGGSDGKESACSMGDLGLIPGSGRSVGEGNGYLLQHSCLENPMGRGVWQAIVHWVTKSQTQQSD